TQRTRVRANSKTWRINLRPCSSRSVLDCGSPLPLLAVRTLAPNIAYEAANAITFRHVRAEYSVASCADASARDERHVLRHRQHLQKGTSLPWREPAPCVAPRPPYGRTRLRLATRSLGCFLQPLPFRRAFSGQPTHRRKPRINAEDTACENFRLG